MISPFAGSAVKFGFSEKINEISARSNKTWEKGLSQDTLLTKVSESLGRLFLS